MHLFSKNKSNGKLEELSSVAEERKYLLTAKDDFFLQEAYKTLRTNVIFSLTGESACKVITVTSSMQSEGKSITACNLGLSFAMADKRVLLIDCDMRKPKLGRLLQLSSPNGLSNILIEPQLLSSSVLRFQDTKMHVILAGNIPPNPSELLGSKRMEKLLSEMRNHYDYIILDSPPINMVTDAAILANLTDGVLFVVRNGHAERGNVQHAVEQLEYAHAKILGFVLNGVTSEGHGYGKYKRYGYKRYGYGYGYGYGYRSRSAQEQSAQTPSAQEQSPQE